MAIIDSKSGKIIKEYTEKELVEKAKEMRAYSVLAITAAGSGHLGGTLSIMDIAAGLYLKMARHDPKNPEWEDRDRIFWSAGHKAPALYVALGIAGYFPVDEVVKLRKLNSGFEGHPHRLFLPGVELSSGSLGQGLGVAVGSALNARLDNSDYRVYCILGDGEHDEGSIWESIMSAAHYNLDNLVAVVDNNGLQIDGITEEVMCLESLKEKYEAFCWNVIIIDGHDMTQIIDAFEKAKQVKGKPTVIIANTIKGKGVSFAENVVGYHGMAPKNGRSGEESLDRALKDIEFKKFTKKRVDELMKIARDYKKEVDKKLDEKLPEYSRNYWWNSGDKMKVKMEPTRNGFGKAIEEIGEDERIIAFGADLTSSIRMSNFYKNHPERKKRFFSLGIAEANMMEVASGIAKEDKISFAGSFGVFATGRAWDQIRTTICYNRFNVKIADAHGGVLVGPDGATHQSLEEIALMNYLPNMILCVPCDSVETYKVSKEVAKREGPAVIRYAREATPVINDEKTPYKFGVANIIRYRKEKENFKDAFEWSLSTEYSSEKEDITIIACGPMVPEAMRAAYILKQERGIETRVMDMHTVKPMDRDAIKKAVQETGAIITCEEHQVGGFGNIVAGVINSTKEYNTPVVMDMIGIRDKFGRSGEPWELMIYFELVAESIAERALDLLKKKE
ncbi:MAG: transketolase [Elusimicrobiota bacterium]